MQELRPYIPDATERTLLRALLEQDEVARSECSTWLDAVDVKQLNDGLRRLLPLLYTRISSWGLQHPKLPYLKDVYLYYWMADKNLRRQLAMATDALAALGSPVVLLKGLALGQTCYPKTECRPSSDIDLLVKPEFFDRAQNMLCAAGFRVEYKNFHATLLSRRDVPDLDLHRSPYHEAFSTTLVAPLFDRLVQIGSGPPDLFSLGDEDQLLHTIAHGMRPNVVSPLRWMVDAVLQLRKSGEAFNWDLLVQEAERLELSEVARQGLEAIDSVIAGVVSHHAIRQLAAQSSAESRLRFARERNDEGPALLWNMTRRGEGVTHRVQLFGGVLHRIWREKGTLHVLRKSAYWLSYYARKRMRG